MYNSKTALLAWLVSAAAISVNGFAVAPNRRLPSTSAVSVLRSEPSDSSSDSYSYEDAVTVESEPYTPTETEALVTSVLDKLPSLTGEVSSETRTAINEALLKLEAMNPTPDPTMSPLLNGVWEMRYAAGYASDWALPSPTRQLALFLYSGGYSPGLFALSLAQQLPTNLVEVGDLTISINREQPRIEASVGVKFFGGTENEVIVKNRLDVESGVRIKETYESASVLGRSVDLPMQIKYARDLYVTYVDEDLLVVRDASGVPEVLVRKSYATNWGTEPGQVDDMSAPGEEELPGAD
mmetsp:Transcript_1243/g.1762  ORF Transcript_1243/g.1762 Transcript_1243/m.1762 type:complete len:296 (-) Transcript_1243:65-952(-)